MLFSEGQTMGQNTNQTQQTQTTEDWLAKVVEAKGENFKDVQVLAKSKLDADLYIKQLEEQLKAQREDLAKQDYAAKLLEQLQNKGAAPTTAQPVVPNQTNGGTNPSDTKSAISEDSIKALVEQTLTQREKESTAAQNVAAVQAELTAKYGTGAKDHVLTKAKELGMSYERLSELAMESPTAFFTLIGEPKKDFKPIVNGTVNTAAGSFSQPSERNWQWYEQLRKTDKRKYYDPKVQQQMFQDKLRLGDRFGN